ncbi:MAG: hypothetical protein P1V97_04825 [Planctomycetota bacterium]|nr:hypothetical protein [Planctomycetota bacterium]
MILCESIFVDSSEDLVHLVYYAPLLILLPYILGPVLVKFTQKMPRRPHFDEVDFGEVTAGMPRDALEFFTKSHESLSKLGFQPRAFLLQSKQVPGVSVAIRLYEEKQRLDYAAAILILAKAPALPEEVHQSIVEFSTRLKTGDSIDTSNRADPDSFPQPDNKDVFRCPLFEDPEPLYQVHQARLEGKALSEKIRIEDGKEAAEIARTMIEEVEWGARLGYFSLSGESYVPTWKGALLMTWRQLWPLKHLQERKFRAQAQAFVDVLGISGASDS